MKQSPYRLSQVYMAAAIFVAIRNVDVPKQTWAETNVAVN